MYDDESKIEINLPKVREFWQDKKIALGLAGSIVDCVFHAEAIKLVKRVE